MKIPLIWLKDYVKTNKNPKEIADSFTALGLMLDKPISNEVLDLEHRFDRSDWLAILGCARDFAAMENLKLEYPKVNNDPGKPATHDTKVDIKIDTPYVKRFKTKVFKNIKVKDSPDWLKERLLSYGMPVINNIVDITNFVMVEYGQPMHAQDLAKFDKREIVIRQAKENEEIVTLDGTSIKLDKDIFILAQNNKPIAIGGVVGGKETGVTETTTEIILDSGSYDQSNIRKTARKLKIQNETVLRYDKFLHPYGNEIAIQRATALILELAGGEYYDNDDYYPNPPKVKKMNLTYNRIQIIGGMEIPSSLVKRILTALEYKILQEADNGLTLEIPYFRTDIEVEDDIVSDVLRISNYKNIPNAQISAAPPKEITPEIYKFEEKIKDYLVNLGLHEHITDPLTFYNQNDKHQIKIQNSFNPEKSALRTNLRQTLNTIIDNYKKHGVKEIGIFEVGKIYFFESNYIEPRIVEVIYHNSNLDVVDANAKLKQLLSGLFQQLGIKNVSYEKNGDVAKLIQNKLELGELRYNSFTLLTENLLLTQKSGNRVISELKNLKSEDLSIHSPIDKPLGEILKTIQNYDRNIISAEVISYNILSQQQKEVIIRLIFSEDSTESGKIKESLIKKLEQDHLVHIRR